MRNRSWLTLIIFGLSIPAFAQQHQVEDAESAYLRADFDRAIELFSAVVEDPDVARVDLRRSYHYLGRAYSAKQMNDEARDAIRNLIDLEPAVDISPELEPPPFMELYYEVRSEVSGYAVQVPDVQIHTIAVIDFTNGSIGAAAAGYDPLSLGLASMMINFLSGATDLKVVERERLQWLLNELDLQNDAGRVDQETAVKAGKLLGAQSVMIGTFIVNGESVYLGTRMVKVETGEILLGEQLLGKADEIFELIKRLSLQAAESINASLEEESMDVPEGTSGLEALMAYSKGLELLERASYEAAYDKFMEALSFDPDYTRAQLRIESLKPMVTGLASR